MPISSTGNDRRDLPRVDYCKEVKVWSLGSDSSKRKACGVCKKALQAKAPNGPDVEMDVLGASAAEAPKAPKTVHVYKTTCCGEFFHKKCLRNLLEQQNECSNCKNAFHFEPPQEQCHLL